MKITKIIMVVLGGFFILGSLSQAVRAGEKMGGAHPALSASSESSGAEQNAEGIEHYDQGHWKVAAKHFREAIAADEKLAEAHYNLALALDKMNEHQEASTHFETANELAPDNPKIAESSILKAHIGK